MASPAPPLHVRSSSSAWTRKPAPRPASTSCCGTEPGAASSRTNFRTRRALAKSSCECRFRFVVHVEVARRDMNFRTPALAQRRPRMLSGNMTDALSIARDLIRCPSVTPADAGALGVLENLVKSHGFEVHRVTFSEPGTADIDNLYARIGNEAPHITFAGHTDVVPPGDEAAWSVGAFSGEVKDGFLHGRGAVDMKGGIACSVAAVLEHLAANDGKPRPDGQESGSGSISFLITGDEEDVSI